jgi:carboxylesterase
MIHSRARTLRSERPLPEGPREFFAPGVAPCVLGMHGFTGTASELRPLVDRVAAAGYAVEVPLMPGHGARADALQGLGFDDWADAMRARMREAVATHGRVVLMGFSLGSLVAMHLAAERPLGVVGLVVLGNALTLHAYSHVPFAAFHRFGWRVPDWYLLKVREADMVDREAAKNLVTYDRHPLRAAFEVWRAGARVREEVLRITCPTLVLHGKRDLVCPPKNARWLAEHIGTKDCVVREYANSAHVVAADRDRDAVAREVIDFVARVGAAR